MSKWFLSIDEDVSGPFSTEEVKGKMGRLPPNCLIWGRGQTDWRSLAWWEKELPRLQENQVFSVENRRWHFAADGQSHGPMSREELVTALTKLNSFQGVMLWSKGMKGWAPVYEFHDVMDEVGVNRREHPRARIKGTITINKDDLITIAQLHTVSQGGVGVTGLNGVHPGQEIQMEIKSSSLAEPIRVKGEVRYTTESGYTGIQFSQISTESKSILIEYIKHSALTTTVRNAA
jgi:hypothetical protein